MVIVGGSLRDSRRGESSGFSKRNERSNGEMAIYIANFGLSIQDDYKGILSGNGDTIPVPMTPDQFAKYIAPTIAHEIGHSLGLVDPDYLEAIANGPQKYHNLTYTGVKLMDAGGLYFVGHRLNPDGTVYWRPDNLRYLRFILPKGE